ncbi:MAG: oxygen-independent coproporphyrinogen III oxidase [Lachnospiraceae bacterium]|nr:radical SAM family heme chaperone HemW [uncultured Acetatifactor sp.]MCI8543278.1 oxygen-independent coproporphyrinogen III oxidase [Lachnospiraceae bacterium]
MDDRLELYFHIPFCVRKCFYCDFLSAPADEGTIKRYMEALLAETAGSALSYAKYTVSSIFIGGGTPSVAPVFCIEDMLGTVKEHYSLAQDAEITMEVNPGTVSEKALSRYREAGVNRLSIGLQSADDKELASIGRIHTWEQFLETYTKARKADFRNINVDIMSALPGQTLSRYRNTLEKVLSLEPAPEHISAYSLILEEGTHLYDLYEKGMLEIPDEDTDRLMYQETKELLARRGYRRYEISNYAKEGCECRHNRGYWTRENYAGFGLGAASLVENVRFKNGTDLQAYLANSSGCREDVRQLSREEQMEEFMFLGLRMTEGVDEGLFRRLFGCGMEEVYGEVIGKNIRDGLLRMDCDFEGKEEHAALRRLSLTEKGLDVSNYVMAQFLL